MIHRRFYQKGEIVTLDDLYKARFRAKTKKRVEPKKIITASDNPDVGIGNIGDISKAEVKGFTRVRRGRMEHIDPFYRHQLNIARRTLSMTPEMANIMGGMTLDEAKVFMKKHKERDKTKVRENRRERESVLRDTGLKKVKGALGGTYWE